MALEAAERALDAMTERGIAGAADAMAFQAAIDEERARVRAAATIAGGLAPRQLALDLVDFFTRMPREFAERPSLALLTRNNRLRVAGLLLLLIVAAAGILALPW